MDVCRPRAILAFALVLAVARAHIASHDNILRVQLWDAEGLSKNPITTTAVPLATHKHTAVHKSIVDLDTLYTAMLQESYESSDFGRFTRHKVRHKRRRPRASGTELPWRFHDGEKTFNVGLYDYNVPWDVIDGTGYSTGTEASVVHSVSSASFPVNEGKDVGPPMTLRQDEEMVVEAEVTVKKQLPVVSKCCASGQNLSSIPINGSRACVRSSLTFQPIFFQSNESHMWDYESNVFEIIVDNPCTYDRYKLDPNVNVEDEFYLLVNGSLFAPYHQPPLLGPKDFCLETFWNDSYPAGLTLPLVCFANSIDEAKTSATLIAYAIGLIISVPFLLATACVYTFITELRDTHGKSLACHSLCLAVAFSCLAATQLAGHAFPVTACTIMAYVIQFSFVSCFFWLNVLCFDTFVNVRNYIDTKLSRSAMRRRFTYYCAYAVVLPLLLLIFTIIMELSPAVPSTYLKPNFGVKGCWFKTDKAALPYFYVPVVMILVSNIIIFFFTVRAFAKHSDKLKSNNAYELTHSTSDEWFQLSKALGDPRPSSPPVDRKQRLKRYRKIFRTCSLLCVIMGLSWVMEVVSWAVGAGTDISFWSVFDVINALQGVVIFTIFVMQQPVRSQVKFSKLCKKCRSRSYSGSEVAVVNERTSIDCGSGRRDDV